MERGEQLIEKFRRHGYKMTPQRRAILKVVASQRIHPTAVQIYEIVRGRMPDTSLATVYNTLRELVAIKEASELDVGLGVRRYEFSDQEHGHLVCQDCGSVQDIAGDFPKVKSLFQHCDGFKPVRHVVTIYGYCASCIDSAGDV